MGQPVPRDPNLIQRRARIRQAAMDRAIVEGWSFARYRQYVDDLLERLERE